MSNLNKTATTLLICAAFTANSAMADIVNYKSGGYEVRQVNFISHGSNIVGTLFSPSGQPTQKPAVVILGPFGSIKEQSPLQYATRLAREGYVTLIFDPRYSGESGGEPRRLESPNAKIQDVQAAIDFIEKQPEVDAKRLALLGICQGTSEMLAVASNESRVKVLTLVSGQYIYPANIDGFFAGGGPTRLDRIARGKEALEIYKKTGEVKYTEVISETNKAAGLPWKPIYDWYHPWTTEKWLKPSRWENRYATMSDAEVWTFDVDSYAPKVTIPTLMIHGEMSDGNVPAAQHVFDEIASKDKKLVIVPGVFHTRFYDDPTVIDPAAATVSQWLTQHLN